MSEPKRRGRPPLLEGEPSTSVNVRVPARDYDRACAIARREQTSVAAIIRRGMSRVLRSPRDDDDDD